MVLFGTSMICLSNVDEREMAALSIRSFSCQAPCFEEIK